MRVVIQRSRAARVVVDGKTVGEIPHGLVCLVGFADGDTEESIRYIAEKIVNLRIFSDENGKMNRSLLQTGGSVLSVSQFTLYGDCRKGRRPSFIHAAAPETAIRLYETFNETLKRYGVHVETGQFGAYMDIQLTNDGPVTLILEHPTHGV